jgi:thermitase
MIGTFARALLLASITTGAVAPLATAATTKGPEPAHPAGDRLIVAYKNGINATRRATARDAVDATLVRRLPGLDADVITVAQGEGADTLKDLSDRSDVLYAERDRSLHILATPNDPGYGGLWNMRQIGAPQAWDQVTDTSSMIVGVVDSGVELDHHDLAGQLWHNLGEVGGGRETNGVDDDHNGYVDDANGWDFYYGLNDPSPNHPHGTHVSGTIGAAGNNGLGVAGVSWHSKIMPVAVMGPDGSGYVSDIALGFAYAADNGARIVNVSLGGEGQSELLRNVLLSHPNTLFVVSAGNDANNDDVTPATPCGENAPNVLCVAATDPSDEIASFSNFGRSTVDVAAPGENILSLYWNDGMAVMSGTSMAAPLVTGVAALTLAAHPWLSTTQLRAAILDGATRVPDLSGLVATGARVSAPGALAAARDTVAPSAPAVAEPATGSWSATAPAVRWTAATDGQSGIAGYDIDVDGRRVGSTPTNVTAFALPALGDGQHSVVIAARDGEGNRTASAARAFGTDATAPTPPAPQSPAVGTSVRRSALAFAYAPAADAASGLRGTSVMLDGRPVTLNAFGKLATHIPVADGSHQWSTTATDNVGNAAASPAVAFTVDDAAPRVSLLGSGRLRIVSGGVTVRLKSGESAHATVTLAASRTAARKLHLRVRHGLARLGSTSADLGASPRTLTVKVKQATLKRLRRLRHVKLRVTVAATDGAGNGRSVVLAGRT